MRKNLFTTLLQLSEMSRFNSKKTQKQTPKRREALTTSQSHASIPSRMSEPWMPIFPSTTTRSLRYSTTFQLTCTAGAVATYVFRANDLFDPDFTSTGHQPMGFDQMMLSYNHFCVVKSRLKVVCSNKTNTTPITFCVRQDASSTPLTVIDRILEFGGLVTARIDTFGATTTLLELGLDMSVLQGVSRSAITADPTLRGDAATTPTEVTYFHVQLWDTAAATSTGNFDIILEQLAVFLEPRDLVESLRDRQCHAESKVAPDSVTRKSSSPLCCRGVHSTCLPCTCVQTASRVVTGSKLGRHIQVTGP